MVFAAHEDMCPSIHLQMGLQLGCVLDSMLSKEAQRGGAGSSGDRLSLCMHKQFDFGHGVDSDQRMMLKYLYAGLAAAEGEQDMSFSVDKSRVFGLGLFSGAALKPDNTCFWMVPQVLGGGA